MKTRTIVSIILATAIFFVTKLRKKHHDGCGCDFAGTDDCIGGEDCDCDGTDEPMCEAPCCDADACTDDEDDDADSCASMAADKVEPEAQRIFREMQEETCQMGCNKLFSYDFSEIPCSSKFGQGFFCFDNKKLPPPAKVLQGTAMFFHLFLFLHVFVFTFSFFELL